ncbi:C40 family peptidase [Alicyclobacillus ferrooxydans]|uniref:C40 family peptidase n=1 Tax=Alicyclobacillus ferrooxydans TaxID=471514 RepID=UPI0006D5A88F|nr:C40 family peptidase [Alicyclobacillus ferrooxydans]
MKQSVMLALAGLITMSMSSPMALASTTSLHPAVSTARASTSTAKGRKNVATKSTGRKTASRLKPAKVTSKKTGGSPSTITYHVQSGDTLWGISQLSGISLQRLETVNSTVNPNALSIGEPILIPTVKAAAVIATAKHYLGKVHYVYGGTTPAGFDCSGFVQYMFAKDGVTLPRTVKQMALTGGLVSKNNLKTGDLIFFAGTNGTEPGLTHIGIYVANGWFIEQSSDYNNVIMARLWGNPFYKDHFAEARRLTSVVQ